jgi:MFS family permease
MTSEQVSEIAVEERLSWTPVVLAGAAGWLGIFLLAWAAGWVDSNRPTDMVGLSLICGGLLIVAALVVLKVRADDRRHRLRLVAFPKENYVKIFYKHKSPRQVPFNSVRILRYSAMNTAWYLFFSGGSVVLSFILFVNSLDHWRLPVLGNVFLLGVVLLCAALLASICRNRFSLRLLLLPTGSVLTTGQEAENLGLPVNFGI